MTVQRMARFAGAGAFVALIALVLAAMPAAADPVKDRQALMKEVVAKNVKLVAAMVKGQIPFNAGTAAMAMNKVASVPDRFVKLFPEGTDFMDHDKSAAKPEIWENMKDFLKRAQGLKAGALAAAKAAREGEAAFKNAFAELVKNCKGCHEKYKEQKN